MDVFDKMINNLTRFDLDKYFKDWISDHSEFITDQNKRRLSEKGTDVDNKQIVTFRAQIQGFNEVYALNTIFGTPSYSGKKDKGQPDDRVTLKDTGAFYKTFKVKADTNQFTVTADDKKPDGNISDNLDVESALGLEQLQPLRNLMIIDLRKDLLRTLRK